MSKEQEASTAGSAKKDKAIFKELRILMKKIEKQIKQLARHQRRYPNV